MLISLTFQTFSKPFAFSKTRHSFASHFRLPMTASVDQLKGASGSDWGSCLSTFGIQIGRSRSSNELAGMAGLRSSEVTSDRVESDLYWSRRELFGMAVRVPLASHYFSILIKRRER